MIHREATPADADAVASLHAESWRAAYRGILSDEFLDGDVFAERTGHWRERLAEPDPDRHVLLAEEHGTLQGFVCVLAAADPRWGALIDNLHVRPGLRGRGLGTALLLEAARWVQSRDPDSPMHLWVYEANQPACRFYEKLGAIPVGREVKETLDGGSAALLRYSWPELQLLLARPHHRRSPAPSGL
jgi:GNAT superfamily N-acetyltransferase